MTRETGWQIAAASFAVGAAAGAAVGAYFMRRKMLESQLKHEKLDVPALRQSLPDGGTGGSLSPAQSVGYSLPATPRISLNGRSLSRSDSLSSVSSVAVGGDPTLRMVFVVRRDLGWHKQKLAVMTAHAALALFKKVYKARHPALMQWELAKGPKLVLRADNEAALMAVADKARAAGLPCHSIAEPTGNPECPRTRSILAIGPAPAEVVGSITAGLVLL